MLAVRTGKTNDNYETPDWIKSQYLPYFDPCPKDAKFDGLAIALNRKNFCNPPYSNKIAWIHKAIQEQKMGNMTVMLLPVDTSTKWFHDLILTYSEIKFLKGRIPFNGSSPPFASMLCTFEAWQ